VAAPPDAPDGGAAAAPSASAPSSSSAPAAGGGKQKRSKEDFTGADGTVYVPSGAILEGADDEARRDMGIIKSGDMKGFAYSYVSKRNMGELSVAPIDGQETAHGTRSP
jgi:hypothetical protein